MTLDELTDFIMKECENDGEPVTREEAKEMAEMEFKAEGIKSYVFSDNIEQEKKQRKPSNKTRKIDEEKGFLLGACKDLLDSLDAENVIMKTETEISFIYNENSYTLKLTKHRPPK